MEPQESQNPRREKNLKKKKIVIMSKLALICSLLSLLLAQLLSVDWFFYQEKMRCLYYDYYYGPAFRTAGSLLIWPVIVLSIISLVMTDRNRDMMGREEKNDNHKFSLIFSAGAFLLSLLIVIVAFIIYSLFHRYKLLQGNILINIIYVTDILMWLGVVLSIISLVLVILDKNIDGRIAAIIAISGIPVIIMSLFVMGSLSHTVVNYLPYRRSAACFFNQQSQGMALRLYAADNNGLFPPSPDALIPKYLRKLPICPSTALEYGYKVGDDHKTFTLWCTGKNAHADTYGYKPGFPQYDSSMPEFHRYDDGRIHLELEGR
ncbi:MAG: hypothetical protein M1269_07570 [Chloroflexi bacterium]|nr:hypothetical protein [Chloroflexota bacterium]